MTAKLAVAEAPETDAAELDALVVDMPDQRTTDKVVKSIIARSLELRLRAAREENERLRTAIQSVPHEAHCTMVVDPWGANVCDCWKQAALAAQGEKKSKT